MTYLKVRWIHDFPDDPTLLYSELDDERYEVRKVEVFADGRAIRADRNTPLHSPTILSDQPTPPTAEIAESAEFDPVEILRDEFEAAWQSASPA